MIITQVHLVHLNIKMAPKNMADVLHSPIQLCYFVSFFYTYCVHNVAATASYDQNELLDIRKAITHCGLEETFL
jgi:hypothetical protein